jgi:hypothetical protein
LDAHGCPYVPERASRAANAWSMRDLATSAERFNYLYSTKEPAALMQRVKDLAAGRGAARRVECCVARKWCAIGSAAIKELGITCR